MNARSQVIFELTKDARIEQAANVWKKKSAALKEAIEAEEYAKKELLDLCEQQNYEGNGVKVLEVERKGSVDYSSIPLLKDLDLDVYRKPSTKFWSVKASVKE